MFWKNSGSGRQLALCNQLICNSDLIFLYIGNHYPVSLFGGYENSAAIGSEGEVIFINHNSLKNSPNSPIEVVSLPDGEKASSVACCNDSVAVLSSNGRVFTSKVEINGVKKFVLNFQIVSELSSQEIVNVSGTLNHFFAVSKEGCVFTRGSNDYGQLGLGKETKSVELFTEVISLRGYEIRAAYAGCLFSVFETREGKLLSCGRNGCGELMLKNARTEIDRVYSPTETTITSGSSFSIAGFYVSAVFIGSGPPPNTRILQYQ